MANRRPDLQPTATKQLHDALKSDDNPDGVLEHAAIAGFLSGIKDDRIAFLDGFTVGFFSAGGELKVSEVQRVYARDIVAFASPKATLDCVNAFGATDFRPDLAKFSIPTLVIRGDSDAIVPFEASGERAHGSELVVIEGGPHAINASPVQQFNDALLGFLAR